MAKDPYHYLNEAEAFYEAASYELDEGLHEENDVRVREAAEKGWNAAVQAVNALVLSQRGIKPTRARGRQVMFYEILKELPRQQQAPLRSFSGFQSVLHGQCFYDGVWDVSTLEMQFVWLREFIDAVGKEIGGTAA